VAHKTEAIAAIPPLTFQDYPIDVLLRIYRQGGQYGADIMAAGRILRVPIDMSPHDLLALNRQVQEVVQSITVSNTRPERLTIEGSREYLRILAEVGHYAFKRIFSHHEALNAIQELLDFGQSVSIEVASEEFFLPWELIYPDDLSNSLSYEHFWGMNHVVSRVIIGVVRPGAFISPVIQNASLPKLGLLTYRGFPAAMEQEIPIFNQLAANEQITLLHLQDLDPKKKQEELRVLRSFWENNFDFVHIACHAFYKEEDPSLSYITVSDNFPISLRDIELYDIFLKGHPLIILNACGTGNLNSLSTSRIAATFLRHGARGVVATECALPDAFAAKFSEQLYRHLFAGETLGQSLLVARRHFFENFLNPLGLLYSLYGPPSIRLLKIAGRVPAPRG
jgi:CHAT domain